MEMEMEMDQAGLQSPSLRFHHSQEAGCMNRALNDALHLAWWHPYAPVELQLIITSFSFCLGGIGIILAAIGARKGSDVQNLRVM